MQSECVAIGNQEDRIYDAFLERISTRFKTVSSGPLFTTNAEYLFDAYLQSFWGADRQYHNCHACRHFIERFGGLVTIGDDGKTTPAIWNQEDAPDAYRDAIKAMEEIVSKAKITGVFLTSEKVLGQPVTGIWKHFYAVPSIRHKALTKTASQAMAEKLEDYKNVIRALVEFPPAVIDQALRLLKADTLYRSEKVMGHAQWLKDLHVARENAPKRFHSNIVWKTVATQKVEVHVPQHGDFIALVSTDNMDAPPIIQWDQEDRRNPVSWYRYHNGSSARQWGLSGGEWAKISAVCLHPGKWFGGDFSNHGVDAMFIIEGAVDSANKSLGLFPEIMKSEFRGIRATIEAFSQSKTLSGKEQASACGLCAVGARVRVDGMEYKIDRWD